MTVGLSAGVALVVMGFIMKASRDASKKESIASKLGQATGILPKV